MFQTKYGKTIKLFLMDADPNGRIICELSNCVLVQRELENYFI